MTSQENDIRPKSMDEEYEELLLEEIKSFFFDDNTGQLQTGMLTKIRARLISDRSLANLALMMGLDNYVLISDSEKAMDGQKRPALLSDTFEAILGALYLDRGAEIAQEWMNDIIETHLSDFLDVDHIVDYKTHLQEVVPRYGARIILLHDNPRVDESIVQQANLPPVEVVDSEVPAEAVALV